MNDVTQRAGRAFDRWRENPWAWAGAALAVRLLLLVFIWPQIDPERINFVDDRDYHRMGVAWAETGRYLEQTDAGWAPAIMRVPLYPAYLAGVYALFGPQPRFAVLGQLAMTAFTCGITVDLARRFAPGRAHWAGLFALTDPIGTIYGYVLFSEALFTLALMGMSWLLLTRPERPAAWLAGGALLGGATLVRPNGWVLLPAFLLLVQWRSAGALLRQIAPAIAGAGLVLTPWLARNAQLTGQIALTGWDLRYAQWARPGGYGDDAEAGRLDLYLIRAGRGMLINHGPTGGKLWARMLGLPAAAHPDTIGHSYQPLFGPDTWALLGDKTPFEWGYIAYSTVWLVVVLGGAILEIGSRLRRFDGPRWFLLAMPLLLTVPVALRGEARYRIPAVPFYAILAAAGLDKAAARLEHRRTTRQIEGKAV